MALETIEHTFGRMESTWKPVAANEGFEVVRRRLFLDCKNPNGRHKVRDQNVRGIESSRIRLGVVQPGESIANFNDALNTLSSSLAYFYTNSSGDRFWYDTRPTLRKTVDDRATQVSHFDIEHEIETRLKNKLRKEQPLSGIHICPASTLDVTDEQTARLVILRPTETYKSGNPDCAGQKAVTDIFNNRGTNSAYLPQYDCLCRPRPGINNFIK